MRDQMLGSSEIQRVGSRYLLDDKSRVRCDDAEFSRWRLREAVRDIDEAYLRYLKIKSISRHSAG
jgi:hypothetical protein